MWRDVLDDLIYVAGLVTIGAVGVTLVAWSIVQLAKAVGL